MSKIFNEINLRNVRGDIFGGITAAVIALPMALAFGVASGAGAEAGLYGAILIGLFAALFGGSPTLISEPTGPMTVVFTAVIAKLIATNPENGMAMAFTVVIMAGIFQVIFGLMKLGKYVTLMPYSVISGFMSGIGIILIILQIGPLLGQASPAGGVIGTLQGIPNLLANLDATEVMLGLGTVAILFFVPAKIKHYVPPQLIALVAVTLISILLLADSDIRRIGEISAGLPEFHMPYFTADQWQVMLVDAVVLGVLGCIDALLTSVIADSITRTRHNSDKELFGQGIGNIMSGLFGGLPGAGATMGTVVSIQAGARSALSGLVRAGILIVVVLWAAGLTSVIPLAVLAGIAFKVGIDIIDWRFLSRAHQISKPGSLITYSVILLTVFVDLIVAVGIGFFVANIMTVTKLSRLQEDDVQAITTPEDADKNELSKVHLTDKEKELMRKAENHLLLFHLQGRMIFGSSRVISRMNSQVDDYQVLVVDLKDVTHLGVSSALILEESIIDMLNAKRLVYIVARENGQPIQRLKNMGLTKKLLPDHILTDREDAIVSAVSKIKL